MIKNVGFGGASLTSIGSVSKIMDLLRKAYEEGIEHYDTAAIYGKGYSEILYGKFLKDKRKNISITTKFGYQSKLFNTNKALLQPLLFLNKVKSSLKPQQESSNNNTVPTPYLKRLITKNEIEKSYLQSLKNLNTNYIDYFMLHEALPSFLNDEALQYLLHLKKNGDVLKIGIASNAHFIKDLNDAEIVNWDVLQYEGFDKEMTDVVMQKFPSKLHFHHSILKNAAPLSYKEKLIFEAIQRNSKGKIIFSTRQKARLYDTAEYIKFHGG